MTVLWFFLVHIISYHHITPSFSIRNRPSRCVHLSGSQRNAQNKIKVQVCESSSRHFTRSAAASIQLVLAMSAYSVPCIRPDHTWNAEYHEDALPAPSLTSSPIIVEICVLNGLPNAADAVLCKSQCQAVPSASTGRQLKHDVPVCVSRLPGTWLSHTVNESSWAAEKELLSDTMILPRTTR